MENDPVGHYRFGYNLDSELYGTKKIFWAISKKRARLKNLKKKKKKNKTKQNKNYWMS